MKRVLLLSIATLMLASCSGESASTSRFIPPSETSSIRDSTSTSAYSPSEDISARAAKIIADQDSLSETYRDYKMTLIRVESSTTTTSDYVYSPLNDFYAAKTGTNDTYLVNINETRTLITVNNGETTTSTSVAAIALAQATFEFPNLTKRTALELLEAAFSSENQVTVMASSIDENDNLKVKVDTGSFLSSYHAYVEMTYNSSSLPTDFTFEITDGTYAGDHLSFTYSYGTSEEDRTYPSI